MVGQSGVGKSSLLNALEPGLGQRVGDISRKHDRGNHTTNFSVLLRLADGLRVIYTVMRRPVVYGDVEITGVDYFSRSKVEDWLELTQTAPVDEQILVDRCNKVRSEYLKRYFPKTEVTATMKPARRSDPSASTAPGCGTVHRLAARCSATTWGATLAISSFV